jgi:hypothetical protein
MANSLFSHGTGISGAKTVTTAGTAEALQANIDLYKSLSIRANTTNTGQVYVGGADVASTTNEGLEAGASLDLPTSNHGWDLSDIYIDVSVSGEGVSFYGKRG